MKIVALGVAACAGALALGASPPPVPASARIDHLILGTADLEAGVREFTERTGVRPAIGGEHPGRGTRNALASLGDGHYIEILAPQAGAADSDRVRALRALTRLTPAGWAISVRGTDAARARLAAAGFGLSDLEPGARARPDGTRLEWTTFEIARPSIQGAPFFIRWGDRTIHPSQDSPPGCRLERVQATTPDADALRRALTAISVDVPVTAGGAAGLEIVLTCPKGPVTFSAAGGASVPR
jgi:hypothetical protein